MPAAKKRKSPLRKKQNSKRGAEEVVEVVNPVIGHPDAAFNKSDQDSLMWKFTHIFSEDQIALILSVLKRKPYDVSIKDYLNGFQKSIKSEETRSNRMVDSGEFWKQQSEERFQQIQQLKTHVGILEKRLRSFPKVPQKPSAKGSDGDEIPSRSRSNTSASHGSQSLDLSGKRKRTHTMDTIPDEDDEMGTDVLEYSNRHLMIVSYLYQISEKRRSLCDKKRLPGSHVEPMPMLCRQLIGFTWEAIYECTLKYADVRKSNSRPKDIKPLTYLVNEIAGSYKRCVEVTAEQYRTINGRELVRKASIIYSFCSFFDKGLSQLHSLCVRNAKLSVCSSNPAPQQAGIPTKNDEPVMIGFTANLLIDILRRVNWQQDNELHEQIIEGILATILNYIGKLMSNIIFHEEVAASNVPGNISSGEISLPPTTMESELESKYLVPILHVALEVFKENKMPGPTEGLVKREIKRIQNTFTNSLIGGNLMALAVPERITEEPLDIPGLEGLEMYGNEWTIQSVFSMVGMEDVDFDADDEMVMG
ncbi:hypothetical protein SBOR_3294 [Sclerotinia borealis F-4128]|uniref:Uncharacterized protein n=1 Tax=Sclerotinia borealis (strain F-4128) TaxID=1432307 RepID=W9CNZ1_SCLBF|nr:hypothetical protein SBOR_3294 [Sclerotinia borealis F-4128]